jgi:hypothetical protein
MPARIFTDQKMITRHLKNLNAFPQFFPYLDLISFQAVASIPQSPCLILKNPASPHAGPHELAQSQ